MVISLSRSGPWPGPRAAAAAPEEVAEQVADAARPAPPGRLEQVLEIDGLAAVGARATAAAAPPALPRRPVAVGAHLLGVEALAQAVFAELVVELALLVVAQDLVGVVDLLEAVSSLLVAGVLVGVQLPASLRYAFLMASASASWIRRGRRRDLRPSSARAPEGKSSARRRNRSAGRRRLQPPRGPGLPRPGDRQVESAGVERRCEAGSRSPGRPQGRRVEQTAAVTLMLRLSTKPRIGTRTWAGTPAPIPRGCPGARFPARGPRAAGRRAARAQLALGVGAHQGQAVLAGPRKRPTAAAWRITSTHFSAPRATERATANPIFSLLDDVQLLDAEGLARTDDGGAVVGVVGRVEHDGDARQAPGDDLCASAPGGPRSPGARACSRPAPGRAPRRGRSGDR